MQVEINPKFSSGQVARINYATEKMKNPDVKMYPLHGKLASIILAEVTVIVDGGKVEEPKVRYFVRVQETNKFHHFAENELESIAPKNSVSIAEATV